MSENETVDDDTGMVYRPRTMEDRVPEEGDRLTCMDSNSGRVYVYREEAPVVVPADDAWATIPLVMEDRGFRVIILRRRWRYYRYVSRVDGGDVMIAVAK